MMPTFDIVPTVSVGTPRVTLRVTHRRSGVVCIPTRSVGTIKSRDYKRFERYKKNQQ